MALMHMRSRVLGVQLGVGFQPVSLLSQVVFRLRLFLSSVLDPFFGPSIST